jgi:pyruvate decarboxylase
LKNGKREGLNAYVFAMQIKTCGDLLVALDHVEKETEKLAIIECCIQPKDISDLLHRFGEAVGRK